MKATTITDKALLVKMVVSQWGGTTSDSKLSADIQNEHGIVGNAVSVGKRLIDATKLEKYRDIAREAQAYHNMHTLPWLDGGYRVIPKGLFLNYLTKMKEFKIRLDEEADSIASKRDDLAYHASQRLKDLFNEADFPSADQLRAKFGIKLSYMPIPDAADFRVKFDAETREKLIAEIKDDMEECQAAAMREVWQRLSDTIEHIHTRLTKNGGKGLRLTMLNNLKELVSILPDLNITGDANLRDLTEEIKAKVINVSVTELRKGDERRETVAADAKSILVRMKAYVGTPA